MTPLLPRRGRAPFVAIAGALLVGATALGLARDETPLGAQGAVPTFSKDVAPILYRNCTTCHRPGGLGPFSLLDYDSAKANGDDIRDAVKDGYMPPWHAEGPHGVFKNDRRLSELEKATLVGWVQGGMKPGDLKKLPAKPTYATGWEIGTPDHIVEMPESFTVPASGTVEYQYFEIPTGFTEDKWVTAIEFMPGAREVVHHVLVYARTPIAQPVVRIDSTGQSAAAPSGTTPPGRNAPGSRPLPLFANKPFYETPPAPPRTDKRYGPPRQLGQLIGGTAPGTNTMYLPEGTALRLRAGTIITFQMHYTAHGHEQVDRTKIGFRFAKEPPAEEMRMNAFINGQFTLPAGAKDVAVTSELEPSEPVRIYGLLPHTHLRGTRWKYELVRADGTREVVLDVPRYDFNWQTYYFFAKPLEIPAGAKLVSTAWYDNSAGNKHNPDATKAVRWGDQTWEEMQYTAFLFTVPSRRLR